MAKLRIGHGYDVHAFGAGDFVVLAGVKIAHDCGLIAHSDGDVVLHALCDALLGAAGMGDIGRHFPDTHAEYSNIDSRILLRRVVSLLAENNQAPENVDITIIAEVPKLAPHMGKMRANIAADLGIDSTCVNLKATTSEGLGFCGRREGIAAHAVCLLQANG